MPVITNFDEAIAACGWDLASQVDVLSEYIQRQDSDACFVDFLQHQVDAELAAGEDEDEAGEPEPLPPRTRPGARYNPAEWPQ